MVGDPTGVATSVSGWGGGPHAAVRLIRPRTTDALRRASARLRRGAIARGMGRSYGDAAQLAGGSCSTPPVWTRFELDGDGGVVTAQAGATLGQLLRLLAPAGWMLPVVPGTQHVTVGGAIASDIHGKNHAPRGRFGAHVLGPGLLTAAGEVLELTPDQRCRAADATIGGMGLTGVILWARIKLRRLASASVRSTPTACDGSTMRSRCSTAPGGPHRVAWLDLLGRARRSGASSRAPSP